MQQEQIFLRFSEEEYRRREAAVRREMEARGLISKGVVPSPELFTTNGSFVMTISHDIRRQYQRAFPAAHHARHTAARRADGGLRVCRKLA